jgi:hypothetical protein
MQSWAEGTGLPVLLVLGPDNDHIGSKERNIDGNFENILS